MVLQVLMIVGVLLVPVPALVLGIINLRWRSGRSSIDERTDRVELALLVAGRVVGLVLLLSLSGITLLSCVGALIEDLHLPSLVYTFFVVDLLIGAAVLFTYGYRARRPVRRRANPARR